jgi:HEPN domain-containing protein
MSDARQAIQAAHAAGAERVAQETLDTARTLLEQAERELESGHYREARRNALGARAQAVLAREQAEQAPPENQQGM